MTARAAPAGASPVPLGDRQDLRLVEWAGPDLLEAAQLALPAMRTQLEALLEVGCDWTESGPDRETLDAELVRDVTDLETAIEATERAIQQALNPPDEGSAGHA